MLIAFWGMSERFTLGYVMGSMVPPYYFLKVLAAFADTPFVYLGVRIVKRDSLRGAAVEPA